MTDKPEDSQTVHISNNKDKVVVKETVYREPVGSKPKRLPVARSYGGYCQ